MKVAFIGGGTMAEAMIGGILSKGVATKGDISVGEVVEERCRILKQRYGVAATTSNPDAARGHDIVVLSVKPQDLPSAMAELEAALGPGQAVLSIVAGARMSTILKGLQHPALVRAMPNTPAQIGAGIAMWTCTSEVGAAQREMARSILRAIGEEIYVSDEKYLDMATALSASGPAYVFLFIECLIDAGVHIGLPRNVARSLTLHTVLGSTKLVEQTGKHPAELKDMVTSPGGTTVEALLALEEGGFRAAVLNAVIAAYEKSVQLGAER